MNLTVILLGLVIIVSLTYIIFRYLYTPWSLGMTVLDKTSASLATEKIYNFIPAANANQSNNYTFACYISPGPANKTKVMGGETDGLSPLFYWTGVFYFVKKLGENKNILYVNTIDGTYVPVYCPPLPEQKWTFLAIVIDGRRFNVLYNGRVVASKLIDNMPNIGKNGKLGTGYPNTFGEVAFVLYNNRAMTAEELAIEYTSSSDTRGRPYIDTPSLGDMFGCPAGLGCFKPSAPPSKAIMSWETPYA